jgi:hypothetical protein
MDVERTGFMPENVIVEVLAAHADQLVGNQGDSQDYLNLFPTYRAELAPLLRVAERVKAALVPVTASPAFEAALKADLLAAAAQRAQGREKTSRKYLAFLRRREVLIGAALGSALSVLGIVAALLWRQRATARAQS